MTPPRAGGRQLAVYRTASALLTIILGVAVGCNCSRTRSNGKSENGGTIAFKDAGPAANPPSSQFPFRCTAVNGGAQFALGSTGGTQDDDDSGLDVPFGINVGQAVGYEGGFAVSAIDGRGGKSIAILALLGANTQNGRTLELGRVYGDADPPRIAGNERTLVVALADMDAAGRTLRLLRVEEPATLAKVTKGGEISVLQNPSTVYSVAVTADRGIVVWDQLEKATEKSQIVAAAFLIQSLALPAKPLIVSGHNIDAESPQIVSRPGGYWAAWVQSSPAEISKIRAKQGQAATLKGNPSARPGDDSNLPPVELGARDLYVSALNIEGQAIGWPLRSTEGTSHVVAYDLATLDDGCALLAWRDDDVSPGVESQVVHVGRVGLDGHIEHFRMEDDSIGVGVPQLLFDPRQESNDRAWLAVGNTGEKVSLTQLRPNGSPTSVIVGDADLGVANPLARYDGTLLVARQRGKGVDLEPLRCQLGGP